MVLTCEPTCLKVTNRNEADENKDESGYKDNDSQKACSHERLTTIKSVVEAIYMCIIDIYKANDREMCAASFFQSASRIMLRAPQFVLWQFAVDLVAFSPVAGLRQLPTSALVIMW